jgi:hypothetical protein
MSTDKAGNRSDPEIDELLAKAYDAQGEEQLSILDEAARLADQRQNVEVGLEVREQIVDAATWAGFYEKSLIAFNWMLAQYDRDRERFGGYLEHRLLWFYKWILEHLHEYPAIARAQIEQTFADMERRYTEAGLGLRAVYGLRCNTALKMGEPERAAEYKEKWLNAEEDGSENCDACERHQEVEYLLWLGKAAAAIKKAGPILSGRMRCAEVPAITDGLLLVPLLQARKLDQAVTSQKRSFRQTRESRKFIGYLGQHMVFHALTGEATKAVKLVEARLPWALETRNASDRLFFLMAVRVLFARLAAAGKAKVKVALPPAFPHRSEDARYDTADLADRFRRMCDEIAAAFDARNGNDFYTRLVAANEELIALPAVELPAATGDKAK